MAKNTAISAQSYVKQSPEDPFGRTQVTLVFNNKDINYVVEGNTINSLNN